MIYIIKHTIAVIIVLLFFSKSLAQSTPNTLPKRELRINVDAIMYQKLKVTSTNSSSLFNSRDIPSGILSVSNYFRIKHNFAIEPSIGFTVIPYNYSYNIELQPSHPLYKNRTELSHHSSEYPLPSSRVGISVS
jgi:hypothetical protein